MDNRHVIGQAVFDIRFSTGEEALAKQAGLGAFIESGVMPVIDDVFTEASESGMVIRMDRLEIDLGVVTFDSFSHELKRRLQERLQCAVTELHVSAVREKEGEIIGGRLRELRMLIFFLEHGYMPWYAERTDNRVLEGLMLRVLKGSAQWFFTCLRLARQKETMLARIASQFPDDVLAEIVVLLEPAESVFIREVSGRPELFRQAAKHAGEERDEVRKRLWVFTLGYLLEESGSIFNRKSYMAGLVGRMAGHFNAVYRDLLGSMHLVLAGLDIPSRLKNELLELLGGLAGEAGIRLPGTARDETATPGPEPGEELRAVIREALLEGRPGRLSPVWPMLLREKPFLLTESLHRHGRLAAVRRNVAEGFSEAMLGDIVVLLEPAECAFIGEVTARPELFRRGAELTLENEERVRKRVWEFTLGYLLEERGSIFNRKSYLASLVRQMAEYGNMGFGELLATVHEVLAGLLVPSRMKEELLELLEGLAAEAGLTLPEGPRDESGMHGPEQEEKLRLLIEEALARGRPETLLPVWPMLLREKPLLLTETLAGHGHPAQVCRKVAEGFPESMIRELVVLLEPEGSEFIGEIAGRPELFRKAAECTGEDRNGIRIRVWEFTLAYLLEERGSAFNRKSFMGSLVRQMAARANIEWRALLKAMRDALPGTGVRSAPYGELLDLMEELVAESVEERSVATEERQKSAMVRARDTVDILRRRLIYGERAPSAWDDDFSAVLGELASGHPEQILLMFHEFKEWGIRRPEAFSACDAEELAMVIELFLTLVHRTDKGKRSSFLRTVEEWAARSGDPRRFLAKALERLLLGLNIDCAALADSQDATREGEMPVEQPPAPETAGPESSAPGREPELELEDYLRSETLLDAESVQRLAQLAEHIFTHRPERLRLMLERLSSEPRIAARLADLLPERLLTRIFLLFPQDGLVSLLRGADLLAAAASALGSDIDSERLRRVKWAFLFGLLSGGGTLPFDRKEALGRFLLSMGREFGGGDQTRFRYFLLHRLKEMEPLATGAVSDLIAVTYDVDEVDAGESEEGTVENIKAPFIWRLDEWDDEACGEIYCADAGLVLAAPYLPRLFTTLGLLKESAFRDSHAAQRGVHLLHYLARGTTAPPEHVLTLNKLLCGIALETPVARNLIVNGKEKETVDGLVAGMIRNWPVIGTTSVDGFRETFLQREGLLTRKDDTWHLLVESRAYDLLLEQIPWSFSVIRLPWMEWTILVEWRHGL